MRTITENSARLAHDVYMDDHKLTAEVIASAWDVDVEDLKKSWEQMGLSLERGKKQPKKVRRTPEKTKKVYGDPTRPERMFQFIVDYKRANCGLAPTVREIGESVGISSVSVVNYHLDRLQAQGRIIRLVRKRGIMIPGAKWVHEEG